jgi:quinolinate synthase
MDTGFTDLQQAVRKKLREKNAILLAHYYQLAW